MRIRNSTKYCVAATLKQAVCEHPIEGLTVELKYSPKGSGRYISGTYYRLTKGYEEGKLIRLRINPVNKYPLDVSFKLSEYYTERDLRGRETKYQKLKKVRFDCAEDLILAIFLHEFSHYLDHVEGLNGRYKQTKADKFAIATLERMQVI